MKKKITAIVLMMAMSAAMLFGCGKKEQSLSSLDISKYVTLGEYSGITVNVEPEQEITDEHVNYFVVSFLAEFAYETEITDRPVQEGDTVYITCVGKVDGEIFAGGSTKEGQEWNVLIGSGGMIPGFEEGMIGMEIGEVRDVPCTFPDPYLSNTALSGKEAVFTITVNAITIVSYPELTEEFLEKSNFGYATEEEFREGVRTYLESVARSDHENNIRNALLSALQQNCEFHELPEFLVEKNVKEFREYMLQEAGGYGYTDITSYVGDRYGMTQEQFDEWAQEAGEYTTKGYLMFEAIAEAEGFRAVSDEELDAEAQDYITQNAGSYESIDDLYEKEGKDTFRNYIINIRVYDWLLEHNTIETE